MVAYYFFLPQISTNLLCCIFHPYCNLNIVFNNLERISNSTQDQLNCAYKNIKTEFYYFRMKNVTIGERLE